MLNFHIFNTLDKFKKNSEIIFCLFRNNYQSVINAGILILILHLKFVFVCFINKGRHYNVWI